MKLNSISIGKVIPLYNNTKKVEQKKDNIKVKDSVQISKAGRNLSSYYIDDIDTELEKKVQDVKNRINNGTYKVSSRLVAKKMLDIMKGRDI